MDLVLSSDDEEVIAQLLEGDRLRGLKKVEEYMAEKQGRKPHVSLYIR